MITYILSERRVYKSTKEVINLSSSALNFLKISC